METNMRFVCNLADLFNSNEAEVAALKEIEGAFKDDRTGRSWYTLPGPDTFALAHIALGFKESCSRDLVFTNIDIIRRLTRARSRAQAIFVLVIRRMMKAQNSDLIEVTMPWTSSSGTRRIYIKQETQIEFGLI